MVYVSQLKPKVKAMNNLILFLFIIGSYDSPLSYAYNKFMTNYQESQLRKKSKSYRNALNVNDLLYSLRGIKSTGAMRLTRKHMMFGFDCDKYPDVAKFIYGPDISNHCNIKYLPDTSSFDLFSDLSLIIVLLALNFISSRSPPNTSQWSNEDEVNDSLYKCPQCDGTRIHMGILCDLCGGMGGIDPNDLRSDDSKYLLPKSVRSRERFKKSITLDDEDNDE